MVLASSASIILEKVQIEKGLIMMNAQITRFNGTSLADGGFDADKMRAYFNHDGFLLIDHFATDEECDSLRHRADQLIENFDAEANSIVFSASGQSHAA